MNHVFSKKAEQRSETLRYVSEGMRDERGMRDEAWQECWNKSSRKGKWRKCGALRVFRGTPPRRCFLKKFFLATTPLFFFFFCLRILLIRSVSQMKNKYWLRKKIRWLRHKNKLWNSTLIVFSLDLGLWVKMNEEIYIRRLWAAYNLDDCLFMIYKISKKCYIRFLKQLILNL